MIKEESIKAIVVKKDQSTPSTLNGKQQSNVGGKEGQQEEDHSSGQQNLQTASSNVFPSYSSCFNVIVISNVMQFGTKLDDSLMEGIQNKNSKSHQIPQILSSSNSSKIKKGLFIHSIDLFTNDFFNRH